MIVFTLSLYFHIILIAVWIGGLFSLPLMVLPALREKPYRREVVINTGIAFGKLGRFLLTAIFITGVLNAYTKGYELTNMSFYLSNYGTWFIVKIVVFLIMVGITLWHERFSEKFLQDSGRYDELRKISTFTGRVTVFLSLVLAWIGIMLSRMI